LAERLPEAMSIPVEPPHYAGPRLACERIRETVEQRFFGTATRSAAHTLIAERQAGE